MSKPGPEIMSGGCLCGGVRYQLTGECRDIINCHCENCRRTHGHIAAYTSLLRSGLKLTCERTLQWYHDESPNTFRGFCSCCGASLFWDARDGHGKISVAAGSLDDSRELKTIGHIFMSEAGKYYEIDDALPRYDAGSAGTLESDKSG